METLEKSGASLNYNEKYIIVKTKEDFLKHIKHKFKKAWYNKEQKLCISEFILLGENSLKPNKFSFVKVIKGVSQKGKFSLDYDFLFGKNNTLVFLGYLEKEQIESELLKMQENNNINA